MKERQAKDEHEEEKKNNMKRKVSKQLTIKRNENTRGQGQTHAKTLGRPKKVITKSCDQLYEKLQAEFKNKIAELKLEVSTNSNIEKF